MTKTYHGSLLLERHLPLLRRGAFLVDKTAASEDLRVLFYLDHSIQDARENPDGTRRVISRRLQFVEIDAHGTVRNGGYAPYLAERDVRRPDTGRAPEQTDDQSTGHRGPCNCVEVQERHPFAGAGARSHQPRSRTFPTAAGFAGGLDSSAQPKIQRRVHARESATRGRKGYRSASAEIRLQQVQP